MNTTAVKLDPRIGVRSDGTQYFKRPVIFTVLLGAATMMGFVSWLGGGISSVTDICFLMIAATCFAALIYEFSQFHKYFSIAGPVFYGGVLIWFCQDYFTNWMGFNAGVQEEVNSLVLAKAGALHALWVTCASAALLIPYGKYMEKFVGCVPDPPSTRIFLLIIIILFIMGMLPYALFTADPLHITIFKSIFSGRGYGALWTTGRSGNFNVNIGGYITELIKAGRMGSILAAFYMLFIARSFSVKTFCFLYWLLFLGFGFGSGTRGEVAQVGLPMMAFLFFRYQGQMSALSQRISVRAWVYTGIIAFFIFLIVQFQGHTRSKIQSTEELLRYDVSQVEFGTLTGNNMFTTTLAGMKIIPEQGGFFANRFPGEAVLRPMPETLWKFVIGPIPRALWTSKPRDQLGIWYSNLVTGENLAGEGTTISTGAVGYWYFRYGIIGVIQGGFLVGWLYGVAERVFQNARGRSMRILFSVGLIVILFQTFRDFWEHLFYPLLIAGVLVTMIVYAIRIFLSIPSDQRVLINQPKPN